MQRKVISQNCFKSPFTLYFFFGSFTVFTNCKSAGLHDSIFGYKSSKTSNIVAEFKVNSTCARSIKNCGILIHCYACAVHTEQYPATSSSWLYFARVIAPKTGSRLFLCKQCRTLECNYAPWSSRYQGTGLGLYWSLQQRSVLSFSFLLKMHVCNTRSRSAKHFQHFSKRT